MSVPMVQIDDELCLAPFHVAALEVKKRVPDDASEEHPTQVWGVLITMDGGNVYFRRAELGTRESARELLATWRWTVNG